MISAIRVCGRCGAKISDDATLEGCPACLLETGLRLVDGDSVAGAVDPGSDDGISASDTKKSARSIKILSDFGDYELLEEIGRGGQGVVYRARQKSLNRTVALKVIGLGPWTTEAHLRRFRREAEAAAHLEHPYIVPIYEVGERDAQCYFSMKFVDGGQLDEVVRHSPMSIRQVAELVVKVARTAHYAHEHGILHRDIKPGNILLDRNSEPHLTDFGLARLVEAESTVTATLDVLGTPSYMAPEQAAGEHTKVSNATDVYGLGAVLYQLLTGQPPFAGGTTYETIRLLRDTEPRSPRLLNPKVDRDLSTICLKCLEKDPQRRYSSALGLAEDLEHWLKHEPIQAKTSGFFTHARKWVRRNPSTTVLVTLLIAALSGVSITVWNHKPAVVIPKSIAVLPFENLSDDPNSAYFADGIQEEILTRLAKIADLKVISRTSTQHYHSKPSNLAEIAKQLGVANIVEGSVQKAADQVRVNVQLIKASDDSHLWADTYDRKSTDIFGVESEIAKRIAESLQAKLTGREEQALAARPTNNPDAFDAYLRGLSLDVRGFTNNQQWDSTDSYKRAVQLDPNFAVAWARLSRAEAFRYYANNDTTRRDAAKRALEQAQKLAPDSPETLLALGYYQYTVLHDYGAAKTTFKRVGELLPGSSEAPYALGRLARREGHWDEAVSYFEQALALDPRNVELLKNATFTYTALRQFTAALKLFDRILDITPNDLDVLAQKARMYQAQGDLPEAARLLSGLNKEALSTLAGDTLSDQLRLERKYDEVIHFLQAQLAHADLDPKIKAGYLADLAFTQLIAGDTAGAKVTAERARKIWEPFYSERPDDLILMIQLSSAYALMGQKDLALKLAERAVMLKPRAKDAASGPTYEENLAVIQTLVGENSRAISTLTQLLQTPYFGNVYGGTPITPALLRLDPMWDPLRSDPAFQKLCEEKINKSIAVLPFENLSGDTNNAYFAEGIQDEILTRLARIADLKVIARTSTQRYQSQPPDLGDIAKQLGVANILEGSVREVAGQVRVNVQLIKATDDSHLWANTYDRKLTNIFGVESEIAKRIAESLQAKLSGREEQALAMKPTKNPEAYEAYLRGLALDVRSLTNSNEANSADSYERAVQLDPNFAVAWARLSRAHATGYSGRNDASERDAAKRALEQAQKLDPDSPETLLALGNYQYLVLRDYGLAKITFERVSEMLPGNSEVPYALARVARRAGRWDESVSYFEKALALDPRNVELLTNAGGTYVALRQFPTALKLHDRVLDITPNDAGAMASKILIYQAQGNLQESARLLSAQESGNLSRGFSFVYSEQLRLERNYGDALRLWQRRLAQLHYDSQEEKAIDHVRLALIQRLAGDFAGAKVTAELARDALEPQYRDKPEDLDLTTRLSWVNALIGEKELALKLAERAVMLRPRAIDAPLGPRFEENLALIQMMVGENSRAISTLTHLLQTPYWGVQSGIPVTQALLRLDPIWDPLRSDPAFQKLCEENSKSF